jgi:hypothetical protein
MRSSSPLAKQSNPGADTAWIALRSQARNRSGDHGSPLQSRSDPRVAVHLRIGALQRLRQSGSAPREGHSPARGRPFASSWRDSAGVTNRAALPCSSAMPFSRSSALLQTAIHCRVSAREILKNYTESSDRLILDRIVKLQASGSPSGLAPPCPPP